MVFKPHYRYRDVLCWQGLLIVEEEFRVIKETPAGYWVQPFNKGCADLTEEMVAYLVAKKTRPCSVRFVLKFSGRRYCHPDRSDAMRSYLARKKSQLRHAETAMAKAKHAIKAARSMLAVGDTMPRDKWSGAIITGMPPEFKDVCFD